MRSISSTFTAFNKRVVPAIGAVGLLLLTIGGVVGAIRGNQPALFFFPLLLAVVCLLVWWYLLRPLVDGVWLDEPDLVVRNRGLDGRIPLASIETVEASYFINPEQITLKLRAADAALPNAVHNSPARRRVTGPRPAVRIPRPALPVPVNYESEALAHLV